MKISAWLIKAGCFLTLSVSVLSCGTIFEEEYDCTRDYRLCLKYDKNIKFADAYKHEVKNVSAYFFDEDGKFLAKIDHQNDSIDDNANLMSLDMEPGKYKMVLLGNACDNSSYTITEMEKGMDITALSCKINRDNAKSPIQPEIDKDITPLFHCFVEEVVLPDKVGVHTIDASFVKNTNVVRVMLQNLSGNKIEVEDFSFSIEADNGFTGYNNELLPDDTLVYKPWNFIGGSIDSGADSENVENASVNLVAAEFTIGRLMANKNVKLTVRNNSDNRTILSIPLIDYILLTKGSYRQGMSDQEYLDRQDEYNIMFFLDSNNNWDKARIIINGWSIVFNNSTLG